MYFAVTVQPGRCTREGRGRKKKSADRINERKAQKKKKKRVVVHPGEYTLSHSCGAANQKEKTVIINK